MPTGDTETIVAWKSKALLEETIKPPATPGNSIAPKPKWIHNLIAVECKGTCFKQDNTTFTHRNFLNLLIVYELDLWSRD